EFEQIALCASMRFDRLPMAHDCIITGDRDAWVGVGNRSVDRILTGNMADKLVFILDVAAWPKAIAQLIDEQVTKPVHIAIQERLSQGLNSLINGRLIGGFGE